MSQFLGRVLRHSLTHSRIHSFLKHLIFLSQDSHFTQIWLIEIRSDRRSKVDPRMQKWFWKYLKFLWFFFSFQKLDPIFRLFIRRCSWQPRFMPQFILVTSSTQATHTIYLFKIEMFSKVILATHTIYLFKIEIFSKHYRI